MSYILGIDPGKATGYALVDLSTMEIALMSIMEHSSPKDFATYVRSVTNTYDVEQIVMENFSPRWGQKFDTTPITLLGAMEAMYAYEDLPPLAKVMPAQHKGTVRDTVLNPLMKAQGYKIGAGHSRDALRLCVYWGFRNRHPEAYKLMGAPI